MSTREVVALISKICTMYSSPQGGDDKDNFVTNIPLKCQHEGKCMCEIILY